MTDRDPDAPPLPVDVELDAVAAVVLDALVVRVDWVVDVLAADAPEELLFDPPHAATDSASGSTVRNRLRGLTIFSIDADHLA